MTKHATSMGGETLPEIPAWRRPRVFLVVIILFLSAGFLALSTRLFYIQVLSHERFQTAGREMSRGEDTIPGSRGDIVTIDHVIVARSVMTHEIAVDPLLMPSEDHLSRTVRLVSKQLGQPDEIRQATLHKVMRARRSGGRFTRIARDVQEDQKRDIELAMHAEFPQQIPRGFVIRSSQTRRYPRGDFLGPVIGVTDPYGRGIEGLELEMDAYLRQESGKRTVLKDARQKLRIYYPENSGVAPNNGKNIILTISSRVQKILEEELAEGMRKYKTVSGLGIVLDCRNGDILAMASAPSYDPSKYHLYPPEERARRRKNRPIEETFEPGSVIKPLIAAWALHHGVTHPLELIWGGGKVHRFEGRRRVTDVRDHGPLLMEQAVYQSSNIGMSILGLRLGKERLQGMFKQFGVARKTGINLPGEAPGWQQTSKRWSELYTSISVSFGYEMRITPIQLCVAFSSVINGGRLYRPRLISEIESDGHRSPNPVHLVRHTISEEVSAQMREILVKVIENEGTGRYLRMDGFRFGGKSGTSDIGTGYSKKDYLASFEAFAPYEDPEIVVLVMMERPKSRRYYGSWVAGPVVAQVLRRYFGIEDQPLLVKRGLDEK